MRFDADPFTCQRQKRLRVSNFTLLGAVFKWPHGNEGVNIIHNMSIGVTCFMRMANTEVCSSNNNITKIYTSLLYPSLSPACTHVFVQTQCMLYLSLCAPIYTTPTFTRIILGTGQIQHFRQLRQLCQWTALQLGGFSGSPAYCSWTATYTHTQHV